MVDWSWHNKVSNSVGQFFNASFCGQELSNQVSSWTMLHIMDVMNFRVVVPLMKYVQLCEKPEIKEINPKISI